MTVEEDPNEDDKVAMILNTTNLEIALTEGLKIPVTDHKEPALLP